MKQQVGFQGEPVGFEAYGIEMEVPDPPAVPEPPPASVPLKLPSYTVATLPKASDWPQCMVYVSNGNRNRLQAISDGLVWRFPDGTIVYK